jgi:hypothetical protein
VHLDFRRVHRPSIRAIHREFERARAGFAIHHWDLLRGLGYGASRRERRVITGKHTHTDQKTASGKHCVHIAELYERRDDARTLKRSSIYGPNVIAAELEKSMRVDRHRNQQIGSPARRRFFVISITTACCSRHRRSHGEFRTIES